MTTPLVPSITDEQLIDLESQCEKFSGFAVNSTLVEQLISRLRAAERDAGRYRWLLDNADLMHWENMLRFSDLEGAESIGQFIDAAIQKHNQ